MLHFKTNNQYTSKKILVYYFIFLVIIPFLILSIVQLFLFVNKLESQNKSHSIEIAEQLNQNMEKQLDQIKRFIYTLSGSRVTYNFLYQTNFAKYDFKLSEDFSRMNEFIEESIPEQLEVVSIIIITPENTMYKYGKTVYLDYNDAKAADWYQKTLEMQGAIYWFTRENETTHTNNLVLSKLLIDNKTFKTVGTIYVEVTTNFLGSNTINIGDNSFMYMVNEQQEILFPFGMQYIKENKLNTAMLKQLCNYNGSSGVKETTLGNQNFVSFFSRPNAHGWITIKAMQKNSLIADTIKYCIIFSSILLMCIGLFISYIMLVHKKITSPLQNLVNLMNEIKADPQININFNRYPCYELLKIRNDIVTLFQENKSITNELGESFDIKEKSELDKLQAQINPHFIFNTLTTINYIAVRNNQKEINQMITALVKILRSSVNRDGKFILISDEIETLREYIYIQSIVHNDKIQFEFDLYEELNSYYIPNFILQPLVENAIFHGLSENSGQGIIKIKNYKQEDTIIFEIIDNGIGISNDINELLQNETGTLDKISNIGIPGIIKRLKLLYNNTASICLEKLETGGTKVILKIPVISKLMGDEK